MLSEYARVQTVKRVQDHAATLVRTTATVLSGYLDFFCSSVEVPVSSEFTPNRSL